MGISKWRDDEGLKSSMCGVRKREGGGDHGEIIEKEAGHGQGYEGGDLYDHFLHNSIF